MSRQYSKLGSEKTQPAAIYPHVYCLIVIQFIVQYKSSPYLSSQSFAYWGSWWVMTLASGTFWSDKYPPFTMVENGKEHRQNSKLINHFPTSEGVSEVSEQANEWAVRANERMDERMAQYFSLYFWLLSTIVPLLFFYATSHLYKKVCPSVHTSACPSIHSR